MSDYLVIRLTGDPIQKEKSAKAIKQLLNDNPSTEVIFPNRVCSAKRISNLTVAMAADKFNDYANFCEEEIGKEMAIYLKEKGFLTFSTTFFGEFAEIKGTVIVIKPDEEGKDVK